MHRACFILTLAINALGVHHAHAQEAIDLSGDREMYFPSILLERTQVELREVPGTTLVSLTAEDLVV
ncbi:MAG TPA: hypothetical protein DF699_04770, partial [Phycisphaerales bacterium]|nr:hypothetical protein [Phycisphaerales bacterium]